MNQKYVYLICAIIFLVLAIILFIIDITLKKKNSIKSSKLSIKDKGIWGFTKQHLLQYSAVFCLVLAIGSFFGFLL
ncbi:hypothetical protein SCORR_v1c00800 [Spiroplasma corruscae]|uniref:Uncharacterized protein n=1 Tax=Spiroplasma corruscae TaxID=216934 RepID=A0A222EMZ5_9MOLU|nr:hypothetical protein [Spiroplasma corruscae]ASP27855.1 hypothetical protein SCORR_v1c00800 [Spiroplasma corruscae]